MSKYFLIFFIFFIKITFVNAEIVKSISVNGNERIADKTIIVFSKINIGDDLIINDLDKIIKNLYETDFFKDVFVKLKDNILKIDVKENKLVQSVEINGVKNKKLKQTLFDQLKLTEKKSYVEECLSKREGPIIAASDYMKSFVDQIRPYISKPFYSFGTDGYGRSDTRKNLRKFFEVDKAHIVTYTLSALAKEQLISTKYAERAMKKYNIDKNKPLPTTI